MKQSYQYFDDYSTIVCATKHASFQGGRLKILAPKQMLKRLPIALTQVKSGNKYENVLNQIIYSLY